jgi:hypothetical protein
MKVNEKLKCLKVLFSYLSLFIIFIQTKLHNKCKSIWIIMFYNSNNYKLKFGNNKFYDNLRIIYFVNISKSIL